MNASEKPTQKRNTPGLLHLLLLALLACVAALSFRKSAGFWMMFPIYPLCVAGATFLQNKLWHRGVFFLAITAVLNLVETDTVLGALPIIAVAFVFYVLAELAVWCFRRKKVFPCVMGAVLAAGCICTNALLFGNPFSALAAQKKIHAYIEQVYDVENGGHTFGTIRFDPSSRLYTLTASSGGERKEDGETYYPVITGELVLCGDYVVDHYRENLEAQAMQEPANEMLNALRKVFPNGSFTLIRLGIDNFPSPEEPFSIYREKDYSGQVSYCIQMGGATSYEKMIANAQKYLDVLSEAGISYRKLIFTGGEGLRYRISLTPVGQKGAYFEGFETGMYVLRHPENHTYLATNGLLALIDRTMGESEES